VLHVQRCFYQKIRRGIYRQRERTAQLVAEISERKGAEQAARENEAELKAYFDASPVGMVLVDRRLRYLKANQSRNFHRTEAD